MTEPSERPEPTEESPYTEMQRRIMHEVFKPWADQISSPSLPKLEVTFFQRDALIWSIEEFLRAEKNEVYEKCLMICSKHCFRKIPCVACKIAGEIHELKKEGR